jgi:hypothetical protein
VVDDGVDGIEVAGQIPLWPVAGERAPVVVNDNSGDGITVSCGPLEEEDLQGNSPLPSGYVLGNMDESVCGWGQFESGRSTHNDHNGVVVRGFFYWKGFGFLPPNDIHADPTEDMAIIDQNGENGVFVDQRESTEDTDNNPFNAEGTYSLGWDEDTGDEYFQDAVKAELIDVFIELNGENGIRIDSAPFAVENDIYGNACLTSADTPELGDPAGVAVTGPDMHADMEDTQSICEDQIGFRLHSSQTTGRNYIRDNGLWAIYVGRDDTDGQDQNIYATLGDAEIYGNGTADATNVKGYGGIHVTQNQKFSGTLRCDDTFNWGASDNPQGTRADDEDTVGCTGATILSNNIFDNHGPGIFVIRSQQKSVSTQDRRVISSNQVHHNAITGAGCTAGVDFEQWSQIIFEGRIILSDPDKQDVGIRDLQYPMDTACYLGRSDPGLDNPSPGPIRNGGDPLSETQCERVNDPEDVDFSGGINNHCLWTGTQCRIAWDMGGTTGTGDCGASDNHVFAYVNNSNSPPFTQKGLVANAQIGVPDSGAFIKARANTWGTGGDTNATFAVAGSGAEIDHEDSCGTHTPACP